MEVESPIIEFLISTKLPIFTFLPIMEVGLIRAEGPIELWDPTLQLSITEWLFTITFLPKITPFFITTKGSIIESYPIFVS